MKFKNISFYLILFISFFVFFSKPYKVYASSSYDMDCIAENYYRMCSVEIYSLDDGPIYRYNTDSEFFCASLIKLPYAVFVCQQLSSGVRSLDQTFTYTYQWYTGGSGVIKDSAYGSVYTIGQLLDYVLRYSDNIAYDMLVYLFGTPGFNKMVERWGFDVSIGTPYPRWPYINASFMSAAMHQMKIHSEDDECWKIAWKALNESTDVLVRDILGNDDTAVAIKYGMVEQVYHEVCFIDSDKPYILVIMSNTYNYAKNPWFIRDVAECAQRIVTDYYSPDYIGFKGDVNLDRKVNVSDLFFMKKWLLEFITESGSKKNSDMNEDNSVDVSDYFLIRKMLLS